MARMVTGTVGLAMLAASALAAEMWSYAGADGPAHWPGLCSSGTMQSPVDIRHPRATALPEPGFHYARSRLRLEDDGHALRVEIDQGSFLRLGAERYELLSIHFHTPAEERINGKAAPMSAHLVHQSADGKLAVVAVQFLPGPANPVLEELLEHLPPRVEETMMPPDVGFLAERLLPDNHAYYSYDGSLTTPPCTEGVRWLVLREPLRASAAQLARLAALHPGNARPPQPLNDREVLESE